MINFKILSMITAVIAGSLFLVLLFIPELLLWLFQVPGNASAFFIGRRTAMLFLGFAVITWVGRNAPNSESRQAFCIGLASAMAALVVLGTIEFIRGFAGIGIFVGIAAEFLLGLGYFQIWYRHKMRQVPA
jgi:hypothetical protein